MPHNYSLSKCLFQAGSVAFCGNNPERRGVGVRTCVLSANSMAASAEPLRNLPPCFHFCALGQRISRRAKHKQA